MDDLISRQAAIDALEKVAELFPWRVPGNRDTYDRYNEAWNDAIGRAEIEIENLPSAQPTIEPRARSKWWHYEDILQCCNCSAEFYDDIVEYTGDDAPKFCPNCGADMRGNEDEQTD